MEGLQRRFKSTTEPNPEDENEFLDEQRMWHVSAWSYDGNLTLLFMFYAEQEELISELRTKNDQSNLAIQVKVE